MQQSMQVAFAWTHLFCSQYLYQIMTSLHSQVQWRKGLPSTYRMIKWINFNISWCTMTFRTSINGLYSNSPLLLIVLLYNSIVTVLYFIAYFSVSVFSASLLSVALKQVVKWVESIHSSNLVMNLSDGLSEIIERDDKYEFSGGFPCF